MTDHTEPLHASIRDLVRWGFPSVLSCQAQLQQISEKDLKSVRKSTKRYIALADGVTTLHTARGAIAYLCLFRPADERRKAAEEVERTVISPYPMNPRRTIALATRLLRIPELTSVDFDFPARLQSYIYLAEQAQRLGSEVRLYGVSIQAVGERPFIRAAMTFVSAAFCVHFNPSLPHKLLPELFPENVTLTSGTLEVISNSISCLIGEAAATRAIQPLELLQPVAPYIYSNEFLKLVRASFWMYEFATARDLISLLNYRIEKFAAGADTIYVLNPGDREAHKFRTMGQEIRDMRDRTRAVWSLSRPRLQGALGNSAVERRDQPYPRFVFPQMPLSSPFYTDTAFDASFEHEYTRRACEELLFNDVVKPEEGTSAGASLLRGLANLARLDRFATLSCDAIDAMPSHDRDAVLNSLVQAFTDDDYDRVVDSADDGQMRVTLDSVTWTSGRLDLLYSPIIEVDGLRVMSAPMIRAARLPRNLLWAGKDKKALYGAAPTRFPEYVMQALSEAGFTHVRTDRKYRADSDNGDLDVVMLKENTLWFFECKFNIPCATPYEERDLVADIRKAVSQIKKAKRILEADRPRSLSWIRKWFPDASFDEKLLDFRGGIILSVRDYSGMAIDQIPIRDVFSLRGTLLGGEGRAVVRRPEGFQDILVKRYWRGEQFSYDDFVAYWESSPPVFSLFQECLVEYMTFHREGKMVRAQHKYGFVTELVTK